MTCHRLALSTLPPRSGRINSPGLFSLSRSPSTNADRRTELMATPADGLAGELPPNTSGKLANPTSIRNVNSLVSLSFMTFCLPRPSDCETPDRANPAFSTRSKSSHFDTSPFTFRRRTRKWIGRPMRLDPRLGPAWRSHKQTSGVRSSMRQPRLLELLRACHPIRGPTCAQRQRPKAVSLSPYSLFAAAGSDGEPVTLFWQ
jgi:hypothetical protein